jgi:hypothetical protein
MHWLDAHQPLVETVAIGVMVLFSLILVIALGRVLRALGRVLRQGRRAMFGAHPVIGPPNFAYAGDDGMVLIVPFSNAAAAPATHFAARVTADGVAAVAPSGTVTLFGHGADAAADHIRLPFDWPVGILDAEVTITWTWRDASGEYDGQWQGHLRVPEPDMPSDPALGSVGEDPHVDLAGAPGHPSAGDAGADAPPVSDTPRVDPLSHIRAGTAKPAQHPEPGQ